MNSMFLTYPSTPYQDNKINQNRLKLKVKGKVQPRRGHEGPKGE